MNLEPAAGMTDEDLFTVLRRSQQTIVILGVMVAVIFWLAAGWQSGVLALAGAAISWTGILEWRSLTVAVFSRLDKQQRPAPASRTVVMFFVRLAAVGAILYASLRFLNGTVYALVAGIGLAVVALSFHALRLLRT
ncbi:MAG TPA: ATP synthase subunit I [Acidobacteriaceae bacterium]|nr:ATP synthase subunit I [Acidobacteriaceae bacterium]